MDSETCVQALRSITEQIQACVGTQGITELCERYKQVVLAFVSNRAQDFPERVTGLRCAVAVFQLLRPKCLPCQEVADDVARTLFLECARVVLGVEFHRLLEEEEPRVSFTLAVNTAYQALLPFHVSHLFHTLLWLMQNYWSHPTLVGMMKGDELETERALAYLREGEFPDLVRLRVSMLVEGGCDKFALNLCSWCIQSPEYASDVFIRQTQLLLLHKLEKLQEFYNQCTQLSCCTAVRLLHPIFCVAKIEPHPCPSADSTQSIADKCWSTDCCMGHKMVECLFEDEDKRPVCLTLAQTFLLQDWMTPDRHCCTRELLRLWMLAQRLAETDNEEFLNSVTKVAQIARSPEQLTMLAEAMQNQFPDDFLPHKTEICLRAMKSERHRLDSARVKKEDDEADGAADGLAKTCRQLSRFYQQHYEMCLSSLLTALYLDPKSDLFFMVEEKMRATPTPSTRPSEVEEEVFKELWDLVETLRPNTFHPRVGWPEIRRAAIFHLENAGYQYDARRNRFYSIEHLLAKQKPVKRVRVRNRKGKDTGSVESEVKLVLEDILKKVVGDGCDEDSTSAADTKPELKGMLGQVAMETAASELGDTQPDGALISETPHTGGQGDASAGSQDTSVAEPGDKLGISSVSKNNVKDSTDTENYVCAMDPGLRETSSEDSGYHCECTGVSGDGVACGAACTKHKDSGYSSDCSNVHADRQHVTATDKPLLTATTTGAANETKAQTTEATNLAGRGVTQVQKTSEHSDMPEKASENTEIVEITGSNTSHNMDKSENGGSTENVSPPVVIAPVLSVHASSTSSPGSAAISTAEPSSDMSECLDPNKDPYLSQGAETSIPVSMDTLDSSVLNGDNINPLELNQGSVTKSTKDENAKLMSPKMATTLALMNGQFPSGEGLPGEDENEGGQKVYKPMDSESASETPSPAEQFSLEPPDDAELESEPPEIGDLQFLCSFCDKPFNTMAQRRRHQEWVCSKMTVQHTCRHCHKGFSTSISLRKHIAQAHKGVSKDDAAQSPAKEEITNVKVPLGLKLRPCTVKINKLSKEVYGRHKDLAKQRPGSRAILYNLPGVVKKFIRMTRPNPIIKKPKPVPSFGQALVKKKLKKIKEQSALKAAAVIKKAEASPVPAIVMPVAVEEVPEIVAPEHVSVEVVIPAEGTITPENSPQKLNEDSTPGSSGGEVYLCPYCKVNCNSRSGRIRHIRVCDKNPNEAIVCEFCQQRFPGLASLNSHYLARHTPGGLASLASLRDENSSGPRQKMKLYKELLMWQLIEITCDKCAQVFSNKMHCTKHQKNDCEKDAGMKQINSFMCKYCESRFSTQLLCWDHTQKCEKCAGDPFKEAKEETFKCEKCEKRYVTEGSLRAHILTLHEEIYPQMLKRNRIGNDAKSIKKMENAVHKLPGSLKSTIIQDSLDGKSPADPTKKPRPRPPRPRTKPDLKKISTVTQRNKQTIEKIAQEYKSGGGEDHPEGQPAEHSGQPGYELPVLSAAEMEQAMTGMPNVDGFLKLLEDDTPIDSHWDLVESFAGNEDDELEDDDSKDPEDLTEAVTEPASSEVSPDQSLKILASEAVNRNVLLTEKAAAPGTPLPATQPLKVQPPKLKIPQPMMSPGMVSPASSVGNLQDATEKNDLQESQKFMIHKNAIMLKVTFYSCTGCKQDFEQKPSFDEHLMSCAAAADAKLHTQKRYQCLFCSAEFESAPQCRRHQRQVCLPGIGIDAEMALNAHFCCDQCSRKFFVKHALKKHMATDHGIPDAEVAASHNLSFLADELKEKLPADVLDKLPLEVKKRLRYVQSPRRRHRPYKPKPKKPATPVTPPMSAATTSPIAASPHPSVSPGVSSTISALSPRMTPTAVSPVASREAMPALTAGTKSPMAETIAKREPPFAQFVPSATNSELGVGAGQPAMTPTPPQPPPMLSVQPPSTPQTVTQTVRAATAAPTEPTAATSTSQPGVPPVTPAGMATLCVGGHMIQIPLHVIPSTSEGQKVAFRAQVIAQVVQLTAVKEDGEQQSVTSMGTLLLQGGTGPQLPVELISRPPPPTAVQAPPPVPPPAPPQAPPPAYPGRDLTAHQQLTQHLTPQPHITPQAPQQLPPRALAAPTPVMSSQPQGPAPRPGGPTTTHAQLPLYTPQQQPARKPLPKPSRVPSIARQRPKKPEAGKEESELVMDTPQIKESKDGLRKVLKRKSSQEEMETMEAALVQSVQDIKAVLQSAQAGADSIIAAAAGPTQVPGHLQHLHMPTAADSAHTSLHPNRHGSLQSMDSSESMQELAGVTGTPGYMQARTTLSTSQVACGGLAAVDTVSIAMDTAGITEPSPGPEGMSELALQDSTSMSGLQATISVEQQAVPLGGALNSTAVPLGGTSTNPPTLLGGSSMDTSVPLGGTPTHTPVPLGGAPTNAPVPLDGTPTTTAVPLGGTPSDTSVPLGGAQASTPVPLGGAQASTPVPLGETHTSTTVPLGGNSASTSIPLGGAQSDAPGPLGGAHTDAPPGPSTDSSPWGVLTADMLPDEEEVIEIPLKRRRLSDSSYSTFSSSSEDILETAIRCIAPGPVPLKTIRPAPPEEPIERIDRFSDGYSKFLEKLSASTGNWAHGSAGSSDAAGTSQEPGPSATPEQDKSEDKPSEQNTPKEEVIKTEPGTLDFHSETAGIVAGTSLGPPGSGAGYAAIQAMQSVDRQLHGSAMQSLGMRPKQEPGATTITRPASAGAMQAPDLGLTQLKTEVSSSPAERAQALPPVQQFLGLSLPMSMRRPASTPPVKPACTSPMQQKVLTPPPAHNSLPSTPTLSSAAYSIPAVSSALAQALLAGQPARQHPVMSVLGQTTLSLSAPPVTMLAWSGASDISLKQGLLGLASQPLMREGSPLAGGLHTSTVQSVRHLMNLPAGPLPPTPSPTHSVEMGPTQSLLLARSIAATIGTPPLPPMTPPQPVMSPLSVPSPHRPLLISPPPYMSPTVSSRTPPGPGLLALSTQPQPLPSQPAKPARRRSRSTSQSRSQTPQSRSHTPQSIRSHTPQSMPATTPPLPVSKPPSAHTGLTPANSPGASTCTSGSICSSPPPDVSKPEDGRISPIVDALLARIKAKTKELEDKKMAEQEIRQLSIKNRKRSRSRPSTSSNPGTQFGTSPLSIPSPPIPPISPSPDSSMSIYSSKSEEPRVEDRQSEEITCDLCWRRFVSHDHLQYHSKFSCPSRVRPSKTEETCPHCHETFHQKNALKAHFTKCPVLVKPSPLDIDQNEATSATQALLSLAQGQVSLGDKGLLSPGSDISEDGIKKKHKKPLSEACKENLKKSMKRKTMCHAVVRNPDAAPDNWVYQCRYCGTDYLKLMSLHSHVLSRHPEMYRVFHVHKDEIRDMRSEKPGDGSSVDGPDEHEEDFIGQDKPADDMNTPPSSESTAGGLPAMEDFRVPGYNSVGPSIRDVSAACASAPTLAGMLINPALKSAPPLLDIPAPRVSQPALTVVAQALDTPTSTQLTVSKAEHPTSYSSALPVNNYWESLAQDACNKVVKSEMSSEVPQEAGMEDEVPKLVLEVGEESESPEAEVAAPYVVEEMLSKHSSESGLTIATSTAQSDTPSSSSIGKDTDMTAVSTEMPAKPLVCHLCDFERKFEHEYSLKCHQKWVHGVDLSDNDAMNDEQMEQELIQIGDAQAQSPGAGNLKCPLCPTSQRLFDRPFSLQCHLRAVHRIKHSELANMSSSVPILSMKANPDSTPAAAQSLHATSAPPQDMCTSAAQNNLQNSVTLDTPNDVNQYEEVLDDKTGQIVLCEVPNHDHSTEASLTDKDTCSTKVTNKLALMPSGAERPHRRARSLQKDEPMNNVGANNLPSDNDTQSKPEGATNTIYSRLRPQRSASESSTASSNEASNTNPTKNGTMSLRKRKPEKPAEEEEDATLKVTRRSLEVKVRGEVKGKSDTKTKVDVKTDVKLKVDSKNKSEIPASKRPVRNTPKTNPPSRPTTRTRKR